MKRLSLRLAAAAIPFVLMIGTNYAVDPAELFHDTVPLRVAELLAANTAATGARNFDERRMQQAYISRQTAVPDAIVLGSSRAMQIRARAFPGQRVFNHAVSGASTQDLVAIAGMYASRQMTPRTVVLVIDPWMLNANSGLSQWQTLTREYAEMSQRLGLRPDEPRWRIPLAVRRSLDLVSPAYFQSAIAQLRSGSRKSVRAAAQIPSTEQTILPDGSRVYPLEWINRRDADIEHEARTYAATRPIYGLGHFDRLDPNAQARLEALVNFYLRAGARVTVLLEPYHPLAYAAIAGADDYRLVSAAEAYLRAMARARGVTCTGSYDPAAVGCSDDEFFDGMHPKEPCSSRALDGASYNVPTR